MTGDNSPEATDYSSGFYSRTPPSNLEAEQSVLGSILLDNATIPTVLEIVKPETFYTQAHRQILTAMETLYREGEPVDLVTLTEKLRQLGDLERIGGSSYLVGLADNTPTAAYVDSYARIVREKATLRELIALGGSLTDAALGGKEPAADLAERFRGSIREVSRSFLREKQDEDRIFEMAKAFARGDAYVSTGFPTLDEKIGGLPRGDLTYMAARNSHGKGMMLYAMAPVIANNERAMQIGRGEEPNAFVYVISPDQHPSQVLALEAARQCGIPVADLQRKKADGSSRVPQELRDLFEQTVEELRYTFWDLVKIRKGSISVTQLADVCVAAIERGACMIAVDTIQRISAKGGAEKGVGTFEIASAMLKDIAGDYDVPILITSQVKVDVDSRPMDEGDGRKPNISDVSGGPTVIGNDAATALMLYNESRYIPRNPMQRSLPLLINVPKNKSGPAGGWGGNEIALNIQPEFAWVYDSPHRGGQPIKQLEY